MRFSYAIIGGGAWGTALGNTVAKDSKKKVIIWSKEKEVAKELNRNKSNSLYLPNINLNKNIYGTNKLDEAIAPVIFYVTPAQYFRNILFSHQKFLNDQMTIVICSKGIEEKTGNLLSNILEEVNIDLNYGILSGPSFAKEVALGMPAALVLASKSLKLTEEISEKIKFKQLRLYHSDDLIGVQVGGAIKNVYAIGCGIVKGINFGQSAVAALIARAIVEMMRFCVKMGGNKETIFGLSGLGDAILTCNSELSRNFKLGKLIGEGKNIKNIIKETITIAEGYYTVRAVYDIAKKNSIEMPVLSGIYSIIYENCDPKSVADKLMARPKKREGLY